MKTIKYIFNSFRIYIISFFICAVSIGVISLFANDYNRDSAVINAFRNSNFESHISFNPIIVEEAIIDRKDSYECYEGTLTVKLSNGVGLNSLVCQKIDGIEYTNISPYNKKNLLKGSNILNSNEVAIPDYYHHRYNIDIDDYLFMDEKPVKVVAIFYDVYTIKEINYESNVRVIFVGKETVSGTFYNYLNLNPTTKHHHVQLPMVSEILTKQRKNVLNTRLIVLGLSFVMGVFGYFFKHKKEIRALKLAKYNGDSFVFGKNILISTIYIFSSSICILMFTFWNSYMLLVPFVLPSLFFAEFIYFTVKVIKIGGKKR